MANSVFSASGMDFQFVSTFDWVWGTVNDHYGSATASFWDAVVPDDSWKPFGTLCVPQTDDPSGTAYMLVARNNAAGSNETTPPLAAPSTFNQVWNDHGTGNSKGDGACWEIVPPDGYVALGTVFNNNKYQSPDPNHYWCIRQDLVSQLGQAASIWTDKGTGATSANMQCYGVGAIGVPSSNAGPGNQTAAGSWALDTGSFLTDNNYTLPASALNVIVLPSLGRLMPGPSSTPQLTPNVDVPPPTTATMVASMDVLFPMISDPSKSVAWQVANPVYTIEIWAQWTSKGTVTTGRDGGALHSAVQLGIQTQAIENWSNQFGVSVSVSDEASVNFVTASDKIKAELSASYAHTWGGSAGTINSTLTIVTVDEDVPEESFAVLWQLIYRAYLKRQDGSYVGGSGQSLPMSTSNYALQSTSYTLLANPTGGNNGPNEDHPGPHGMPPQLPFGGSPGPGPNSGLPGPGPLGGSPGPGPLGGLPGPSPLDGLPGPGPFGDGDPGLQ